MRPAFVGQGLNFRVITLKEPPKTEMIDFLEREHRKQPGGKRPSRCARVEALVKNQAGKHELHELLVNIDESKIMGKKHLVGKHSYIDSAYMKAVEAACLANKKVQEEIRKLDLPPGSTAIVEPWAYATDGMNDMSERITMVRRPV